MSKQKLSLEMHKAEKIAAGTNQTVYQGINGTKMKIKNLSKNIGRGLSFLAMLTILTLYHITPL